MVNGLDNQWRPVLWLVFAYSAVVLVSIVFLAEETWYDRTLKEQVRARTTVDKRTPD